MYIMIRGQSAWLCPTAADAWNSHAMQIRLRVITNFVDFQQQLDAGVDVRAGVITVFKCSDATACEECALVAGCESLRMAQDTDRKNREFAAMAEHLGGDVFY